MVESQIRCLGQRGRGDRRASRRFAVSCSIGRPDHGRRRTPDAAPGRGRRCTKPPRYALIEDSLQGVLRTPICGQHIHVGMPDEQTAVRAYNGIRTHVPLINALASNSPVLVRRGLRPGQLEDGDLPKLSPRRDGAGVRRTSSTSRRVTRQVCAAGGLDDYTHIWWDVRIHPGARHDRDPGRRHPVRPPVRGGARGARPLPGPGRGRARPGRHPGARGARRVELPGDPPRARREAAQSPRRARAGARARTRGPSRRVSRSPASSAASANSSTSRSCSSKARARICSAGPRRARDAGPARLPGQRDDAARPAARAVAVTRP